MKAINFLVVLCLGSFSLMAQEQTVDPKANAILQSLDKKLKAYKAIKAEITLNNYNKDGKQADDQKITLWLKGGKYKLDIKNQTVFCDSITIWTYLKDAKEVQINKVDPNSDQAGLSPTTIFNMYEKGYKSRFDKEESIKGVVTEEIDLYPKHPEKEKFHTIKLYIDKAKNQIVQIKKLMKDGTTQLIIIDKFTSDFDMPDSEFKFDPKKFPGVDVEDLR